MLFKLFCKRFGNKDKSNSSDIWVVSWTTRFGKFCTDKKDVYKAFVSHDDAKIFKQSLEEACKILQYTEDINVRMYKQ